jgi:anaerobic ribonucleoside-triphosphate reductase activating protein
MDIAIAKVHFPVRSLGYGARIGIWVQGCSIHCRGCIVPETWVAGSEHRVRVEDLLDAIAHWLPRSDGITISGGEPFDQPEALHEIVAALRSRTSGDILVYSGYPQARLRRHYEGTLQLIDAVVAGPFRAGEPDARPFIGSANQELMLLSNLGRQRYDSLTSYHRGINVDVRDGEILFAGVPERGHLRSIVEQLRALGVYAETTHDPV